MRQTDKIGFEDIFDLADIEKVFEQTLEADILKLMDKWEKEKNEKEKQNTFQKSEQYLYIEKIVRQVIREEINNITRSNCLFNEHFFKALEVQGFERNCPTCCYNANKQYGTLKCY